MAASPSKDCKKFPILPAATKHHHILAHSQRGLDRDNYKPLLLPHNRICARGRKICSTTSQITMEDPESPPGSPGDATTPLQPMTPDRVNQQRDSSFSTPRSDHQRDSSIHEKIQQFNNMSRFGPQTAATMTKQLERKTADAALKRAMLGREEAESDMRRFREETRLLRKQIEEGKERERRVGERLETVMVSKLKPLGRPFDD
jgi:hypothetical protein